MGSPQAGGGIGHAAIPLRAGMEIGVQSGSEARVSDTGAAGLNPGQHDVIEIVPGEAHDRRSNAFGLE